MVSEIKVADTIIHDAKEITSSFNTFVLEKPSSLNAIFSSQTNNFNFKTKKIYPTMCFEPVSENEVDIDISLLNLPFYLYTKFSFMLRIIIKTFYQTTIFMNIIPGLIWI